MAIYHLLHTYTKVILSSNKVIIMYTYTKVMLPSDKVSFLKWTNRPPSDLLNQGIHFQTLFSFQTALNFTQNYQDLSSKVSNPDMQCLDLCDLYAGCLTCTANNLPDSPLITLVKTTFTFDQNGKLNMLKHNII